MSTGKYLDCRSIIPPRVHLPWACLMQNLLFKVCSHVKPAFSGCWSSRFSQEPGEVWNFTYELVRAREREGNQAGIWRRMKDWDTTSIGTGPGKLSGWGKWDQGVRLGLRLQRLRLCLGDCVLPSSWPPAWHSTCTALQALFLFTASGTPREHFDWPILSACLGWIMPQDCCVFSALTTKGSSDGELRQTPLCLIRWGPGSGPAGGTSAAEPSEGI